MGLGVHDAQYFENVSSLLRVGRRRKVSAAHERATKRAATRGQSGRSPCITPAFPPTPGHRRCFHSRPTPFNSILGHAPSAPAGDLERDGFLKRRKERNFGFKLFIRTFIQVCAYRFQSSLGSNSFSFDVVNSLPFQRRLKKEPAETRRLFDRTSQVVRFVRALLGDGLKCDDLQTLPDTTSLDRKSVV